MKDIRAFVKTRHQELTKQIDEADAKLTELETHVKTLRQERDEIEKVARTIGIVNGLSTSTRVRRRVPQSPTIKEAVLEILQAHPRGMLALDILREINARHELELKRTSLSPQLSRLKQEGKIENEKTLWLLTQPKLRPSE